MMFWTVLSLFLAFIALDIKLDKYYKRKKVERDGEEAMLKAREKFYRGY